MGKCKKIKVKIVDVSTITNEEFINILDKAYRKRKYLLILDRSTNTFGMTFYELEDKYKTMLLSGHIKLPEYESIEEEILSIKYSSN